MSGLELNASFRSDDYDDVGSNDSFKAGILYATDKGLTVKGNWPQYWGMR